MTTPALHTQVRQTDFWRDDVPAAIVVFLIAVPLCLGIALASGVPLFAGIIAGMVGGIVVGALSGSPLMVTGPAAGLTAVVVSGLGQVGSFDVLLMAVVLAGGVQILLGLARAGLVAYYFPTSVVRGMLFGVGLTLVLKQIPHALGYDVDAMGDAAFQQANRENSFSAIAHALGAIEWGAVLISGISLLLLALWPRLKGTRLGLFPAPLGVAMLGVALNAMLARYAPGLALDGSHLVRLPIPSTISDFFSQFTAPNFAAIADPVVWRLALLLAAVASLETLLAVEATDKLDPAQPESPVDRELVAQGAGNLVSGLIGGLPIAGVVARSAANVGAGARSRRATMLQGALLLVAALLIPQWINLTPLAAIAAMLIHLGLQLAAPKVARSEWSRGSVHAVPFTVTVLAIVVSDLLIGILVGLAVGVYYILRDQLLSPPFTEVSSPGAVLRRLQLHDNVNFLHRAALVRVLETLPAGSRIELDGRSTRRIDPDVLEAIEHFQETALARGIDLRLVGVPSSGSVPPFSP